MDRVPLSSLPHFTEVGKSAQGGRLALWRSPIYIKLTLNTTSFYKNSDFSGNLQRGLLPISHLVDTCHSFMFSPANSKRSRRSCPQLPSQNQSPPMVLLEWLQAHRAPQQKTLGRRKSIIGGPNWSCFSPAFPKKIWWNLLDSLTLMIFTEKSRVGP